MANSIAVITPILELISAASWEGREVVPQEWLVEGMIPMYTTTCLSGDGGLGKSLLAMQLMTCCAGAKDFLGRATASGIAIGLFCEDHENQLHERQNKINEHYGLKYSDLADLNYMPRVGADNSIVTVERDKIKVTSFFTQFRQLVLDCQAKLIVIDTAADTFVGNENIRSHVRSYIQLLNGLANDVQGAVVLLVHPSLSGLASGTGTSGSTAWNNSVRSRWYLERPKEDNEIDDPSQNIRILSQKKSNYSAIDKSGLELEWKDGVFQMKEGKSSFLKKLEMKELSKKCLEVISDCVGKNIYFSLSEKSQNYAPRKITEKLKRTYRFEDVKNIIEQMVDYGILLNVSFRNNGREFFRLEPNTQTTGYSEPIDIAQNDFYTQ